MKLRTIGMAIALLFGLAIAAAQAASINLSISITSPASTAVSFTPASPFTCTGGTSCTAPGPIASGTTVGTFSVAPTGWSGALALSGTNAANFSLSGMNLVTAVQLPASTTDAITVTATP